MEDLEKMSLLVRFLFELSMNRTQKEKRLSEGKKVVMVRKVYQRIYNVLSKLVRRRHPLFELSHLPLMKLQICQFMDIFTGSSRGIH
jgi:hypothetical protein